MKGTETYEAIVLGLGAISHMAGKLESMRRTFEFSLKSVSDADDPGRINVTLKEIVTKDADALMELARKVSDAMEFVGDFLSDCDSVSEDDQDATEHAFKFMHSVLAINQLARKLADAIGPCCICGEEIAPDDVVTKVSDSYRHSACSD